MQQIDIFPDDFPGFPIISGKEIIHYCVGIYIRIPYQLGQQVGTQFCKFTTNIPVALFEESPHIVVAKVLHIGLQCSQIGERGQKIGELYHVVPKKDIIGQISPSLQIPAKCGIALFKGNMSWTFDITQHDIYILPGSDIYWRFPGVLVGQGGDNFIRKFQS